MDLDDLTLPKHSNLLFYGHSHLKQGFYNLLLANSHNIDHIADIYYLENISPEQKKNIFRDTRNWYKMPSIYYVNQNALASQGGQKCVQNAAQFGSAARVELVSKRRSMRIERDKNFGLPFCYYDKTTMKVVFMPHQCATQGTLML